MLHGAFGDARSAVGAKEVMDGRAKAVKGICGGVG